MEKEKFASVSESTKNFLRDQGLMNKNGYMEFVEKMGEKFLPKTYVKVTSKEGLSFTGTVAIFVATALKGAIAAGTVFAAKQLLGLELQQAARL